MPNLILTIIYIQIFSALVEVTGARIIISDINVRETEAGTVDVTG